MIIDKSELAQDFLELWIGGLEVLESLLVMLIELRLRQLLDALAL